MFKYFRDAFYTLLSWFCRNILWLPRILGLFYRILKWIISGWRRIFILPIVAFVIIKETFLFPSKYNFPNQYNWYVFSTLFILTILFFVVTKQKKRIVIEPFVDFTGADPKKGAKGLSTLLMANLLKLQKTFSESEAEQTPVSAAVGQCRTINAAIIPGQMETVLKSLESGESEISFGFLKIPIGLVAALFARMVKSPRILATLHKDNETIILNAQITGWRKPYNWQVVRTEKNESMEEMLEELSYRIFNHLYMESTESWSAIKAVGEGLSQYRDSLGAKEDKRRKLKKAERKFMEALSKDPDFDLIYYNLGLVYLELEEWGAAEPTFIKAVENNPERWESYYALALACSKHLNSEQEKFDKEKKCKMYNDIIQRCERAIALKPYAAEAYNQKAITICHEIEEKCNIDENYKGADENYKEAIKSQIYATKFAYMDLWIAKFSNWGKNQKQEEIVVNCLQNLAKVFYRKGRYKKAEILLQHALSLDSSNKNLYFELGKIYHIQTKNKDAINMYKSAIRIMPRQEYWAFLSLAYEKKGEKNLAEYAFKKAKEYISCIKEFTSEIEEFEKAYRGAPKDLEKLEELRSLIVFRAKYDLRDSKEIPDEFRKYVLNCFREKRKDWRCGWIFYQLGKCYSRSNRHHTAVRYFKKAKEVFEEDHRKEMKYCEIEARLAESLAKQGFYHDALKHALNAVNDDPLYSPKRKKLGEIYFRIEDYDLAENELEKALLWNPNDQEIYWLLGLTFFTKAWGYHKSEERNNLLKRSIDSFRHALDLLKREEIDKKGAIDYAIGRVYDFMGEHNKAISYFEIADAIHRKKLLPGLQLGWQYFKNGQFEQAEKTFLKLIDYIEKGKEENRVLGFHGYKDIDERVEGEIIALIYYALAFCWIDRDAGFGKASELLEKAEDHIKGLRNNKGEKHNKDDQFLKERIDYAESYWEDGMGWLAFKRDDINGAIEHFQKSIDLKPHPRVYLHMALAYEKQADAYIYEEKKAESLELSRRYCMNAKKTDVNEEHRTEIEVLLARLDKK